MNLVLSSIMSFEVFPFSVLGTNFKNVKILAIFDRDTAELAGMDTRAQHALMYPFLPSTVPNDPSKYNYVKIRMPSGETQILGMAWIDEASLEIVNLGKFVVELDNISSSDQSKILEALSANNLIVSKIEFISAS